MAETFKPGLKYRTKPRTFTVNGFEVPEPMSTPPKRGIEYFIADPTCDTYSRQPVWCNDVYDEAYLSRRICHTTKEAAIAHAKAMLGIDPNQPEE